MQLLLAARGENRGAPDRTARDDCGDRILDRRPDRGGIAGGARRIGLFPRRRGRLHARGARWRCSASAMPTCRDCGLRPKPIRS